jgi:hypothetical protein
VALKEREWISLRSLFVRLSRAFKTASDASLRSYTTYWSPTIGRRLQVATGLRPQKHVDLACHPPPKARGWRPQKHVDNFSLCATSEQVQMVSRDRRVALVKRYPTLLNLEARPPVLAVNSVQNTYKRLPEFAKPRKALAMSRLLGALFGVTRLINPVRLASTSILGDLRTSASRFKWARMSLGREP